MVHHLANHSFSMLLFETFSFYACPFYPFRWNFSYEKHSYSRQYKIKIKINVAFVLNPIFLFLVFHSHFSVDITHTHTHTFFPFSDVTDMPSTPLPTASTSFPPSSPNRFYKIQLIIIYHQMGTNTHTHPHTHT